MSFSWRALHAQLLLSTTRPTMFQHFKTITQRTGGLEGFADIGAVIAILHHPDQDRQRKNAILGALVDAAQQNDETRDTTQTILLLALWPGLCGVRRRLVPLFGSDTDLLPTEILSRCCEVIATLDLTRVSQIAATILMNVERDLRRSLIRESRLVPAAPDTFDTLFDEQACIEEQIDEATLEPRLADLFGRDARLVISVALHGMTQKEAAQALGLGHDVARKRYQRAMKRLEGMA